MEGFSYNKQFFVCAQQIIEDDTITLDWLFQISMLTDIVNVRIA
jgi:hypothetical protein